MLKDRPSLAVDENVVDSSVAAAITFGPPKDDMLPNACPSQTQSAYLGGCDSAIDRWGTYLSNSNSEGLGNGSHATFNDSSSLPCHGYGYTPLMPQRPCAPFITPAASVSHHGQLYNIQDFPNLNSPYYQQTVPPNIPFCQAKLPVNIHLQGNANRFGSQRGYLPTLGSFAGENNFSGNSRSFKLSQQEFVGSGGLDWSKLSSGKSMRLQSSVACTKPIHSLDSASDHYRMGSQQKESFYILGSRSGSSYKSYPQALNYHQASYKAVPSSILGKNDPSWPTLDEARSSGRCNDFACSCSVALDTLSERNRGPRAFKPRSEPTANAALDSHRRTIADAYNESLNRLDFVTDYKYAKFFVIKSYSEDNVHKSIKYGVWASTANGNKKLDAAYHEAKENPVSCPVFLLFSVNASAQFCGVAEMVGPVDFDKSVDFWQQDKWSGQFPVKWHIIKDVPNSLFRHIVLQNNENKPVTNSRDTQEVELDQGVEMLNIFQKHDSHSSILDDFLFYEERQKAMQMRKLRQQASPASPLEAGVSESNLVSIADNVVKKMSKSFAEAVTLKENETNVTIEAEPKSRKTVEFN